jgi:hypothetical protein
VTVQTGALLEAALEYARRQVPVFPVWGIVGGRCGCGRADCKNPGKHPLGPLAPNGFKDATTDAAVIREWWRRYPAANIGTPTSWCIVLDADPRHGGDESLAALARAHGPLPETPEVLTGGGGRHLYFAPPAAPLRSSAGGVAPGLDIRGDGGYVLLPPSRHVSGGTYADEVSRPLFELRLAPMPAWLEARARATAPGSNGDGARADWSALLRGAPDGRRHDVAVRIAGHYLGLGLPPGDVEEILVGFGARCTPPADSEKLRRIVRDLAAKDAAKVAPSSTDGDRPSSLAVLGAGDFLAQDAPEPEAYIEGILSDDGGGWLGGEDKTGKTWWAIEEAVCLALGLPVCGRFAVPTRRRVAVLEEEDSPRRTRRRLRAILRGKGLDTDAPAVRADLNQWCRVSVWSGFSLDNPVLVAQLRALIADFRPAVLYIDCLRKVTIRDLNKAPEASALLALLDAIRREFGVIFRLVHHYRKVQGFRAGRGSQEIGGSYVLGAWGENSLFFEPIGRKQGTVRVEVQSKDGAPVPGFRLRLESEGPRHAPTVVRLVVEEDAADGSEADEAVFQAVATLPPALAAEGAPGVGPGAIAAAVKKSEKTVKRSLDRLLDAGRVVVTGRTVRLGKLYAVKAS